MKELTNTFNEEGIDSKGSWSDEDFQAGRKKWAASRFARVISFQKPSHEELSSGKKIHLVWTYEVAGTVYQEDSVFMSCGLQKIAVKGLTAASLSDAKKKAVREIMASVRCE